MGGCVIACSHCVDGLYLDGPLPIVCRQGVQQALSHVNETSILLACPFNLGFVRVRNSLLPRSKSRRNIIQGKRDPIYQQRHVEGRDRQAIALQ